MQSVHRERAMAFLAGVMMCTAMSGSISLLTKHSEAMNEIATSSKLYPSKELSTTIAGSMRVSHSMASNDAVNDSFQFDATAAADLDNATDLTLLINKSKNIEAPASEMIIIDEPVGGNGVAIAILTLASAVACSLSIVAAIGLLRRRRRDTSSSPAESIHDGDERQNTDVDENQESNSFCVMSISSSCEDQVVFENTSTKRKQERFRDRVVRDEVDDITPEEAV